jgi:proteasome component ECM29
VPSGGARQQQPPAQQPPQQQPPGAQSSGQQAAAPAQAAVCTVPAGMSEYGFRRVCGEGELKAEQLEQIKLGIIRFLSGSELADADKLCHLVVAAADTRFAVAEAADSELKKISRSLEWSCATLTQPLFLIFLGNLAAKQVCCYMLDFWEKLKVIV